MCLSKNIRQLRLQKNMTQEQLASSLNISAQAVSKWETGENSPDSALLLPLAHELGVSLDELFSIKDVFMADISKKIISLMKNTMPANALTGRVISAGRLNGDYSAVLWNWMKNIILMS